MKEVRPLTERNYSIIMGEIGDGVAEILTESKNKILNLILENYGTNTVRSELAWFALKREMTDWIYDGNIPDIVRRPVKHVHYNKVTYDEWQLILKSLLEDEYYDEYIILFLIGAYNIMPSSLVPPPSSGIEYPKITDLYKLNNKWYLRIYQRGGKYKQIILDDFGVEQLHKYIDITKDKRGDSNFIFGCEESYNGKIIKPMKSSTWWYRMESRVRPACYNNMCVDKAKHIVTKSFQGAGLRKSGHMNESHYERAV